ncbi:MAG TPA: DUF167 domain-containing protein [Burkholderiales bacterium]|nr:DUF167 domain-containing protein [Burkholderiales bacterium]
MGPWAKRVADGWLLSVHVQPGAKATQLAGLHGEDLKVRIAAPPVDGRANAALEELVAGALGVPRRCVRVVKGATSRRKTVHVAAPGANPALLAQRP